MTDENEETFEFILDEDNKYEMTIDQAIDMHKAMQKGANKMLSQKAVLADCGEYADPTLVQVLKADIRLLSQVIERCYTQQELINLRSEQIIGLN